ncbi:DUF4330 domain-containing protein [Ancylothrix sp. C2]|uniref:DUF4330 domain-containing protein n=1 Tax=Ancylothrix sp. D3o TaxID=2953691 RepID=UPI0021BB6137|nr:DUF4330 domain-containing protein [Ancylothrix sp. D3o]MCT7951598.1 DUF4330 domain-containing protein [Ancylothrix sp. D3o]
MKVLDSQGRLFGKVSILDVAAGLVIFLVVLGIFFFPGTTGSVAQIGVTEKPVEVDIIVRGLSVRDPDSLVKEWQKTKKTNIIIRNQPYGQIDIKNVLLLDRLLAVPQPDGTVKPLRDPRVEESYSANYLITLTGKAKITKDGPVLGNEKLKIGTNLELDGFTYNFKSSVIDVRVLDGKSTGKS